MVHRKTFSIARVGLLCAALVVLAGCGQAGPPYFYSNMVEMNKNQITSEQQQDIVNLLTAAFGTPDDPEVLPGMELDIQKLRLAAGPVHSDQYGRESGLYRRHCAHCHGTTGDGMGPTAMLLNPYPRDYRQGIFKFKATELAAKPTHEDLETVLRHGVTGTAMPSFDLLPSVQVDALVEYVKYLSLRGQTELRLIDYVANDLGSDEKMASKPELVTQILGDLVEQWKEAPSKIINPPARPDIEMAKSIDAGRELFYTKANCAKCHGWGELGDGQLSDYDDWMKPLQKLAEKVADERVALKTDKDMTSEARAQKRREVDLTAAILKNDALPPRTATPRNLRQNIYRGGRRPVDLYRRVSAGIAGMPMPGMGGSGGGGQASLTPDEIWAVVDYVLSLPYESISRPPDMRPTTASVPH